MQNPFRNHPQDEPGGRHEREEDRHFSNFRPDEPASWREDDGAHRYAGGRGQDFDRDYRHEPSWDHQMRHSYGPGWGQGYGGYRHEGRGAYASSRHLDPEYGNRAYGGSAYGEHRAYGGREFSRGQRVDEPHRSYGMASHAYAPGSQIWETAPDDRFGMTPRHHDFEADYLHWRQEQMSNLDRDYHAWRQERRQKFSSDFDTWRRSRPRDERGAALVENPIVNDIADGGEGHVDKKKL